MTIRKKFTALLTAMLLGFASPAHAVQPTEEFPIVKLQSLDKTTARTQTFEARVGSTVKFGPLYIKVQACRKTSPIDLPESAAFLQIWELTDEDKPEWVFSGWMFASSPGLSSMDHPIYDVWVLECLETKNEAEAAAASEKEQLGVKTDEGEVKDEPAMPGDTGMESAPVNPETTTPAPAPAPKEGQFLRLPPEEQAPVEEELPIDGEAEQ